MFDFSANTRAFCTCAKAKNYPNLFLVCLVKGGGVGGKRFDDQEMFLAQISAHTEQGLLEKQEISSLLPAVEGQWHLHSQDGEVLLVHLLFSLKTFPNFGSLNPLMCHHFRPDVNCQAALPCADNQGKNELVDKAGLINRTAPCAGGFRILGKPDMWGDIGAKWRFWTSTSHYCYPTKFHRYITLPSSHSRFLLKLQPVAVTFTWNDFCFTRTKFRPSRARFVSFYLKPPQLIVAAVPKVLNKNNLDEEGWVLGKTLDCMWGLRALTLWNEGQQRLETLKDPGENLDLLGVPNFVSILGVVHKANKNHWSVLQKQSSLINLRMQDSLFFEGNGKSSL